jgi:hypothetical protein
MTQNGTHELESQEMESKVQFVLEHPVAHADRGTLARPLGAPDTKRQVLDHWDAGERVVVAVLIRGNGGASDASQLLILGCRTSVDAGALSELSVASTNRAALDLYDRWRFRHVGQEEEVFRLALR